MVLSGCLTPVSELTPHIDTNIVLDILYNRKPFVIDSLNVFRLCETKKTEGYISILFIANIIYILRKELNNNKI